MDFPQGCLNLGVSYEEAYGVDQSNSTAKAYYKKACDLGLKMGCDNYERLDKGTGETYGSLSNEQLENLCKANDRDACLSLGAKYHEGIGVKKSFTKANEFYERSCDLGDGVACFLLGNSYFLKEGVRRSYSRAFELYKKSCELGSEIGCFGVGLCYENGDGVRQSISIAKDYYKKACNQGYEESCEALARLNKRRY